ncbi:hypothetical protein MF271_18400 (plasmid) [Deinococcus sp. KNUC1210]|uniref:hypothetical protein n=1 Tax=Deinococcus sp. KNUC1210 TaxID=2917691 RepID=UPI001EF135E4|nr:hypothetical protein [Deinococcus sp. KNUC1210]ULH17102.1 hypothetical protein MF271_18400 [Deinococcus sp. KNUC1210]
MLRSIPVSRVRRPFAHSLWILGLLGTALAGGGTSPTTTLPSPSRADATMTALTTGPDGQPVLAWVELSPSGGEVFGHLHAVRWNGGGWTALGGLLNENPVHNAWQLSAVHGPDGQPWLGWAEDAGTAHVDSYLMSRWSGSSWSDPGLYAVRRNLSDAGKSRAFTVTTQNQPYLTWTNIYYPGAFAQVVQPFYWQPQAKVLGGTDADAEPHHREGGFLSCGGTRATGDHLYRLAGRRRGAQRRVRGAARRGQEVDVSGRPPELPASYLHLRAAAGRRTRGRGGGVAGRSGRRR